MKYIVRFDEGPALPPRAKWRPTPAAASHEAARIAALQQLPQGAIQRQARRSVSLTAWVAADCEGNRHKNGLPICLHKFILQLSPTTTTQTQAP